MSNDGSRVLVLGARRGKGFPRRAFFSSFLFPLQQTCGAQACRDLPWLERTRVAAEYIELCSPSRLLRPVGRHCRPCGFSRVLPGLVSEKIK